MKKRTHWGSGRSGHADSDSARRLNLNPGEFSEAKTKGKKSLDLPPETDAEAQGKCIFHEVKLSPDGTCRACLKDDAATKSKKARITPEQDLFDEVGHARAMDTDDKHTTTKDRVAQLLGKGKVDAFLKKANPGFTKVPPPRGKVMDQLSQAEKEFDKPKPVVEKKKAVPPVKTEDKQKAVPPQSEAKKASVPRSGGGKGVGPKVEGSFETWSQHLRDLPETIQIICDAHDPDPLIVFTVEKKQVSIEQLKWLESLRTEPRQSFSRRTAERKIAELLFGFQNITEAREAIEHDFVQDDKCENVEVEMAKVQPRGAWYNEWSCNAIDPEKTEKTGSEENDIQLPTSIRTYRLRDFWENFSVMAKPYSGDGFEDLEVVF